MKRFIKITCTCLAITMLLTLVLGNKQVGTIGSGCNKTKLYEYGDFIITEDNKIYDFSDQGLQKEYIVIPETINGKILQIYNDKKPFGEDKISVFRYSDKIKKIYNAEYLNVNPYKMGGLYEYVWGTKEYMLKDIGEGVCVKGRTHKSFYNDSSKLPYSNIAHPMVYYVNNFIMKDFCERSEDYKLAYKYQNIELEVYATFSNSVFMEKFWLANIEFMYNYENAPNQGHYWIDDLETGETLTYLPPNPTREGYTFGGWYADKDCTLEYRFDKPYEKKDYVQVQNKYLFYPNDYVTYIYAKWI